MSCLSPIRGHKLADGSFAYHVRHGQDSVGDMSISCGGCVLCRAAKAVDSATRIQCEFLMHEDSSVLTLTYDDEHVPRLVDGRMTVRKVEVQRFVHSLRVRLARVGGPSFRYHARLEYSPELGRPHVHMVLFGFVPSDSRYWAKSQAGNREFSSAMLTALWGKGTVTFQRGSAGAASYLARHQAFKLTGEREVAFLAGREPERVLASRWPAIGLSFLDAHEAQIRANDFVVVGDAGNYQRRRLPRYFDRKLKQRDPSFMSERHAERAALAQAERERLLDAGRPQEDSDERLRARAACTQAQIDRGADLKRGLR